jgi:ABC-2 type transport system permease protein
MAFASCAACWATMVALRFRTQQAAPLMQVATLISILFTTAYAPFALLAGWLHSVAVVNPVTRVLEGVRQGFVGPQTWGKTWPALLALAGLLIVLGGAAVRQMRRVGA